MLAEQVDDPADVVVLADGDDVLGLDVADGQRVEAVEHRLEDRVGGDHPVEPLAVIDRRDHRAALDEHAGDLADVVVAAHARRGLVHRRHLRVVLDVRPEQLALGEHADVLAALGRDDRLRVLLVEDRPDLPQALVDVDLDGVRRRDVGDVHQWRRVRRRRSSTLSDGAPSFARGTYSGAASTGSWVRAYRPSPPSTDATA